MSIMIGEIRDAVTGGNGRARTRQQHGHLVLATLHAPIAAGAVQSMLSYGVPHHFLGSALRGVIAQVPAESALCPKCKTSVDLSLYPQIFEEVTPWLKPGEGQRLFAALGCEGSACRNRLCGTRGRVRSFDDRQNNAAIDLRKAADAGHQEQGGSPRAFWNSARPPFSRWPAAKPAPTRSYASSPRNTWVSRIE